MKSEFQSVMPFISCYITATTQCCQTNGQMLFLECIGWGALHHQIWLRPKYHCVIFILFLCSTLTRLLRWEKMTKNDQIILKMKFYEEYIYDFHNKILILKHFYFITFRLYYQLAENPVKDRRGILAVSRSPRKKRNTHFFE